VWSGASAVFEKDLIRMRHTTKFAIGRMFVFSLHNTRKTFPTRTTISFCLKTEMNSFRNDLYGNDMSFQHYVNKYREIHGVGINSLQNECHSSIICIVPYSPEKATRN